MAIDYHLASFSQKDAHYTITTLLETGHFDIIHHYFPTRGHLKLPCKRLNINKINDLKKLKDYISVNIFEKFKQTFMSGPLFIALNTNIEHKDRNKYLAH